MRDVKTTRLETYKEVAIVEKSIVKQCAVRVGSIPVCKRTLHTMKRECRRIYAYREGVLLDWDVVTRQHITT